MMCEFFPRSHRCSLFDALMLAWERSRVERVTFPDTTTCSLMLPEVIWKRIGLIRVNALQIKNSRP